MNAHVALSDSKRQLLEKMLRGGGAPAADKPAPIAPRDPDAPIPLSSDQRQVWLHGLIAPETPLYNESVTIHRFGSFDAAAMSAALDEIVRRHESWRTDFRERDGELFQHVRAPAPLPLPIDDVSHLPPEERDAAAVRIATADARDRIDLLTGPLVRARIVRIAEDDHRLYLTLHHIIFDGVAIYRVILPELAALYTAFTAGEASPLGDPGLQYGDYALWQRDHLESPAIARQVDYWRGVLADAPAKLEIPGDRPRPRTQSHAGSMEVFRVPQVLTDRLRALARDEGVTLYMVLLASFHALLHRYTGEEDIVVGGVTDLRRRPELDRVVGYFLNAMALRAKPRGEMPFRAFLADVRDMVLGALAASEAPLDRVVRALDIRHEVGRHPLFNFLFSIQPPIDALPPGWHLTQMDVAVGGAKYDLYFEMEDRPDGIEARFLYSTELYDAATITRMIGHWLNLLEGIADDPGCTLGDLPMVGGEEMQRLLIDWNATALPAEAVLLPEMVAAQARSRRDAVAVRFGDRAVSYTALDRRADAIAAAMAAAGFGRGDLIGICLDRSPDMVAALLGVHRAGAAYLPLDPDFPPARLDYIVRDAGCAALLSEARLADILPGCTLPRILIDDVADDGATVARAATKPGDLAYVLYTSGSTGNPKGVEISHGALMNLLAAMRDRPGFGAGDSLLAVTTLSFDIAALELFLPLITGGELIVAPRSIAVDPRALAELIASTGPSVMQATPATWRALIEAGWRGDPRLRILCGGEAFPRDLAEALLARAGQVWNMYGPTETTIWSTVERVTHADGPVPIGRPIANTQIHILDAQGNSAPIGMIGELFIGGAGLATGYRGRPDLTAERFVEARAVPGVRLYRTGDLARYRPDGTILCLGRVDNDEKIRGYRVAVEEIEGALARHADIAAAAVRSWPDASGERALAAYMVAHGETRPGRSKLREYLAQTLPDYMIPSHFEWLSALPMTPNGKIDRKALPQPGADNAAPVEVAQGETEERLAAIWCDLLRVGQVGRDDSFFDLGGHSLLVARLLVRIEQQWGRRIGMAEFFRAPQLRTLAARIDGEATADLAEFVPLQGEGDGLPILWLDGGLAFRPLAEAMGTARPFLGLPLGPIIRPMLDTDMTFEQVATAVVAVIRKHQPNGPYLIGGWCTNGILAYEVARQLRAAGADVPLLTLGHSMNPAAFVRISTLRMRFAKVRYHLNAWRKLPFGQKLRYAIERARGVLEDVGVAEADVGDIGYHVTAAALENAAYSYVPGSYDGPVVLFQPIERLDVLDCRPGWAEAGVARIEAHDIPGSHGTMVEAPNVALFAARLKAAVDRASPVVLAEAAE